MKRQSLRSKYGFTLFELMLVISIFAIFIGVTGVFNVEPQNDIERADRMLNRVAAKLRTESQNIAIGRMPNRDGVVADKTILILSTGSIITNYMSGATLIGSETFAQPFFDGDMKYIIRNIVWTGSTIAGRGGQNGTGELIIEPSGMTFSGIGITGSGYTMLEIRFGYSNATRKVILDKRTGKVTEKKLD